MHGNRRSRGSQRKSVYPDRYEHKRNNAKIRSLKIMRSIRHEKRMELFTLWIQAIF